MAYGKSLPGSRYIDPRIALSQGLIERGTNTGPVSSHGEGLGRLAQALLGAYMHKQSMGDRTSANKALSEGLMAKQWTPPAGEGVYRDGQGPIRMVDGRAMTADGRPAEALPNHAQTAAPAGGYAGAQHALGQMPENPYAAELLQDTAMQQYAQQQALAAEARKVEQAKALELWKQQNLDQNVAPGNTVLRNGQPVFQAPFKPEKPIPGRDVPYTPEVAAQLSDIAAAEIAARLPKYEPSGTGVQVDTRTGEQKPAPLTPEQKIAAKREELQPKAFGALQALERQSELVTGTIDKALALISPWSTGYGSFLASMPNTDARALKNELDTIKANVGFDKLADMRANSPTGGALGNVSENENKLLQAVNGALDPGQSEQLEANLKAIRALYPAVLAERRKAYEMDYGGTQGRNSASQQQGNRAGNSLPQPPPGFKMVP